MSNIAISFEHVSKMYQLGVVGTGTISNDLKRWWYTDVLGKEDPFLKIGQTNNRASKASNDFVYALRDIDFKVEQGDVVGIIGKNGAGKSTLLKLLSRITAPTTGCIKAKGRIASLLEVGTGFHPELTGRENIYLNGSIMGMTKREIDAKLDEIVDFSGCEMYIDTPTKRYSSGMQVRLGFAVAAFLEPEILVVDEVLAVGDAEFQKKAIGKMNDVATNSGRTVLFVSHNMASVRSLCKHGVVLKNGEIGFVGTVGDAIDNYIQINKENSKKEIKESIVYCCSNIQIDYIKFNGSENIDSILKSGQNIIEVEVAGFAKESFDTDLMLVLKNSFEIPLATLAEGHIFGKKEHIGAGSFCISKQIVLPKILATGNYYVDINLHMPMVEWQMRCLNCVELHIDGYFEGYGRALKLGTEGFVGLTTINRN